MEDRRNEVEIKNKPIKEVDISLTKVLIFSIHRIFILYSLKFFIIF